MAAPATLLAHPSIVVDTPVAERSAAAKARGINPPGRYFGRRVPWHAAAEALHELAIQVYRVLDYHAHLMVNSN